MPASRHLVRIFICYASHDRELAIELVDDLRILLEGHSRYDFDVFMDLQLLPGTQWRQQIIDEANNTDIGLLLLSPAWFTREFILSVELPILRTKGVFPVLLRTVDFQNTAMHGVAALQIFRGHDPSHPKPFPRREGDQRDRWMQALVAMLSSVLDARFAATTTSPTP